MNVVVEQISRMVKSEELCDLVVSVAAMSPLI